MADKFTTIRVYEKDKEKLLDKHGGPAHVAFHRVITTQCNHPEDQRAYVMADLPMPGEEALTQDGGRRQVGGFYCGACRLYIFRNLPLVDPALSEAEGKKLLKRIVVG